MVKNEQTVQEIIRERKAATATATVPLSQIPSGTTAQDDYGTTKAISSFIALLGWIAVIIGGIAAIAAFSSFRYGGILALLPSLAIIIAGLFLVISGQVTQAIVDNTNHNRKILGLLKNAFPQSAEADPKVLMQKAQELYESGICPECNAEIEADSVRCETCGTNLFGLAASAFKAKEKKNK